MNVLITGASSGIGAATARLFAASGHTVGIVGRRADRLHAVLEQCLAAAPESRAWVADLGDLELAEAIADEAEQAFGGVDVLINNAAVPKRLPVTEMTPEAVEQTMGINFLSPVRMTLRLLPHMLARMEGTVVNVASMGGRLGIAHETAYCASKFALTGWSEAMAIDLHGTGVKVRLIQPGPIDTDIWDRPGERPAAIDVPKEPPSLVAQGILDALSSDRFEHYLPDLKGVVDYKQSDIDGYIAMTASMVAGVGKGDG
ncbi:MAG TPA: SDR family oxidoreductase [Acidimicrobiales bacterium]|nr:SDR family oxidoreductase [Acidimicrobiales bacterium]